MLRKLLALAWAPLLCSAVIGMFGSAAYAAPAAHIPATAAASQNLAIGPAIVEKTVAAGTTGSGSLTITNGGDTGYNFSVYATPYGVQNEQYMPSFIALPGFANITQWFQFSLAGGYLKPHSAEQLTYSIHVPAATAPGSYYAAVFAQISPGLPSAAGHALQFSERVGSLFYITAPGQALQKGSVGRWSAQFLQQSPARAALELRNDGKLYYISTISVSYSDILGHIKYQFNAQKIVLSRTVRLVPIAWPHSPSFGLFKVGGSATIYGQQTLGTKYILIMSKPVRVAAIVVFSLIILVGLMGVINVILKRISRHGR